MDNIAVAAILFPVKDSFIKEQDERVLTLLAIAIYFTLQSLFAICNLVCLRGQRILNPYPNLSAVALASWLDIFFDNLQLVPFTNAVTQVTVHGLFCLIFAICFWANECAPSTLCFWRRRVLELSSSSNPQNWATICWST